MADRLAHPLDLVLAALVQRQLDPRRCQDARRAPARCMPSSSSTPSAEAADRLGRRLPVDVGLVDLLDAVAGMREPVRERAVVRQEERAGRVGVEPADRDDALRHVVHELDDRRPSLRVAGRRHGAGRLVQEDVGELLRRDGLAVDLDPVARWT